MRRRREIIDFIRWISEQMECCVCGISFEGQPEICDWDHVTGKKEFAISNSPRSTTSWHRVLSELSKCSPVCANHHRLVTSKRIKVDRKAIGIKRIRELWKIWHETCRVEE